MKINNELKTKLIFPIVLFFCFSIIGWLWEGLYEFLRQGFIANHGVLLGPWLPIYGFGGVLIYLILKRYRKYPLVVFMGSFVFCTVIEYITGWWLETYQHHKWWSYVNLPFNIDGRICLLSSIFFGLGGVFVIYMAVPKIKKMMNKFDINKLSIYILLLLSILIIDYVHSFKHPNMVKKYQIININSIEEIKLFKK